MLRPTMDKGSLSTMASLGQFIIGDTVRGSLCRGKAREGELPGEGGLMLNNTEIIKHVTAHAPTFESVCAIIKHDPNPRRRADHLRFLVERAWFRTVVWMYNEESRGTSTSCYG